MLVLSRKEGERIVIPAHRITITVLNIATTRVRVGVSAPEGVEVYREELWKQVCAEPDEPESEPPRLLLADADAALRADYAVHLRRRGFRVDTAGSALECLQRLRESPPDLLVLDPAIPWGGGDGLLALMRDDPVLSAIPVIVLTYGRDRGVLYRLATFQIDDLQFKPLAPKRLAERIRVLLERGRSRSAPGEPRSADQRRAPSVHRAVK